MDPHASPLCRRWRIGRWRILPIPAVCCYLASGLLILGGIASLLGDYRPGAGMLTDLALLLAALAGYEAALLCLSLVVGRWQACREDTRSLLVIAAVLLTGSGIAIDTLAVDRPWWALWAGLLSIAWAGVRYRLIATRLTGSWPIDLGLALLPALLLTPVAAGSVGLVHEAAAATSTTALTTWWIFVAPLLLSWLGLVVVMLIPRSGAWRRVTPTADPLRAIYLQRALLALLLVGCAVRLQVLAIAFDFTLPTLLLPALALVVVLVRLSLRAAGASNTTLCRSDLVLLFPTTLVALHAPERLATAPALVALAIWTSALFASAWRDRCFPTTCSAIWAGVLTLALCDHAGREGWTAQTVDLLAVTGLAILGLLGLLRYDCDRAIAVLVPGIVLVWLLAGEGWGLWATTDTPSRVLWGLQLAGCWVLALALFRTALRPLVSWAAGGCAVTTVLLLLHVDPPGLAAGLAATAFLTAQGILLVAVCLRQHLYLPLLGLAPLGGQVGEWLLDRDLPVGWLLVAGAFLLLAGGGLLSWRRARRRPAELTLHEPVEL